MDTRTWNALIEGYVQKNQNQVAFDCFERMQCEGLRPDAMTLTCILKACGSAGAADRGEQIHAVIAKLGLMGSNIVIGSALVSMHAKCGALAKAQRVLEELPQRNVVSWNALIAGYVQHNKGQQALHCFKRMQCDGLSPDAVTFTCILKACGSVGAVGQGEKIHHEIAKEGLLNNNLVVGNALVDMYAKCGALAQAQRVLEELPVRDIISWNTLIAGYAQQGKGEQALNCLEQMQGDGLSPDSVTFICILKACGSIGAVDKGEKIHEQIAKQGLLVNNIVLGNALVDMYVKCGVPAKARQVLEDLPVRNVISWSALIAGYAQLGKSEQALSCFEQMQLEGVRPNDVTFIYVLKACGSLEAAVFGEQIHNEIVKQGLLGRDILLDTALLDMYAKCGDFARAQCLLEGLSIRNVNSWNALIAGFVQQGENEQVLDCFEQVQREGLSPNSLTFICMLKACGSIGAAEKGAQIHHEITKQKLLGNDHVLGTTLLDMYAKCGAFTKAQQVLEELPMRDVVSWNALITGYAQYGESEQVLNCLEGMQRDGLSPDAVTFLSILKALGSLGAADKGEKLHDEISKQGLVGNDIVLATALLDMYARCGALTKARGVLEKLPVRDIISWNSLIARSVQQGESNQALVFFKQMLCDGCSPDVATFSSVLSACSRLGLVEDAEGYFIEMSTKYGLKPDLEHYTCMIDIFGRAGYLDKAVGIIEKMSFFDIGVWSALLSACQKWGDVNLGKWAFECALEVDKHDAAIYAVMTNVYIAAGMQEHAKNIESLRRGNKAWNKRGMMDCFVDGTEDGEFIDHPRGWQPK